MVSTGSLGVLGRRLTPEFSAPDNHRLLEQATLLQVVDQASDRLVGFQGVDVVVAFQVTMSVPVGVVVVAAGIHLDKPHAPFDQPPGHQALATEIRTFLAVQPIRSLRLLGLRCQVGRFWRR